ncbi:YncE family protein [Arachidicoccus sp.]|uniref:YncE family protein n=1 Tax=Arachidicoccus sp. TaxID=1872624 RepID=UPI003D225B59
MKRLFPALLLVMIVLVNITWVTAQTNKKYFVAKTLKIGGDGGWDYLAVHQNNLYVSHSKLVNIINKKTGALVGVINGTIGVHGFAFVPALNKGFISEGRADSVIVFDLSTYKILARIATGKNPDAIMYDDFSKKIIVCDGHSNSLSIIDPVTEKVVATIALAGKPETAVADGTGKVYVNIEDKSLITEIDLARGRILNEWPLSPGEGPSGLAFDKETKRLFAGCDNQLLVVMNANNGKIITTLPIGRGCDGVAFDDASKQVFSSNGEGTLTVIKEMNKDNFVVQQNLLTKKGARTIALDTHTHTLYLPTANFEKNEVAHKRPVTIPGSFEVLVVKPLK